MNTEILTDLGFTNAEAIVYLKLIETGPVKVGKIIEKTKLQSSTIHNTLNSLTDKGFITYILKGKIKTYQAVDPRLVLKNFKEREQRFSELIPQLQEKQRLSEHRTKAELYEGIKGITTVLNEFIKDTKKGDPFYFFSIDVKGINSEIQKFFERYDVKRKEKGLKVRGLARKELKPLFEHRKHPNLRYVDFPIPSNVSMCNNKIVLLIWGDTPTGVMVHSPQLYESHVAHFNEIWKNARS